MIRTLIARLHWLLGISAGIVLALVGLTGAALSFETELIAALNRDVMNVTPAAQRLPLRELLDRVAAAYPQRELLSIGVHAAPDRALQVTFLEQPPAAAAAATAGKGPPRRRGEPRYVDPYRGILLGTPQLTGRALMRAIERVHRGMVAGTAGRAVVGASTSTLVWLALSGLYLRWPRRGVLRPGTWLRINGALRGRAFLWNLHAVAGTWLMSIYLLLAASGLYFAYEWYRQGLVDILGATPPAREAPKLERPLAGPVDAARLFASFERLQLDYESATLILPPSAAHAAEVRYLRPGAAHERAFDRIVLHPQSGAVLSRERFLDKDRASRLIGSMLALHSGAYFGLAGRLIVMLASLAMPLFAVTGWMLYLQRRARRAAQGVDAASRPWAAGAGVEP